MKTKKEKNLKQIDGKWYVDFTFNKRRIRQFGGYTKAQARNTLAKLRIGKLDEKLGFKKPESPDIDFTEFAREFIEIYSKQNKRSWGRDESSLKVFRHYFKGKTLRDIGPELIERYKATRRSEVAPGTVNRELCFLKTLFNKAVEWGRLESSPATKIKKLKEPNSKDRILDVSETESLLDATENNHCSTNHLKAILIIALNTGMRKGEILALKWDNIDLLKRNIHIEDSKSGKSRDVPMNALVIEALSSRVQNSVFVFVNPATGKPIENVKSSFRTACKQAEIKSFRFHDLRHTAATRMVEAGVDLVTVSKILGHSTIQMTMRYAHPTTENMRLAVDKLGEFYKQRRQKLDTVIIQPSVSPLDLIN